MGVPSRARDRAVGGHPERSGQPRSRFHPLRSTLESCRIDGLGRQALSFDAFLDETSTDGLVIAHRGQIVCERYANGMTAETPHILMSVSKSLLGLLAGVLVARGDLEPDRPVTDVIPEVAATAYRGATIRHLLDMRVGVAFDEDYLATSGPIIAYRKAVNWNPLEPWRAPDGPAVLLPELTKSAGPHGGPFNYVSPNTDLLGWVIERATGMRYADLMSELLWKPMGAAQQRLHHRRPVGRAALRGRRVRDGPRSRASRPAHGPGGSARRHAGHPGELDRRHHSKRRRRTPGPPAVWLTIILAYRSAIAASGTWRTVTPRCCSDWAFTARTCSSTGSTRS